MLDRNGLEKFAERASKWVVVGIPVLFLVSTVGFGTVGTYRHLSSQPAYAGLSRSTLLLESFLTGVGFLVLNSGPFPSPSSTALPLVLLGRLSGIGFVLSTVVIAAVFVFTQRLKRIEIELTYRLAATSSPPSNARHTLICGLTAESVDLTLGLREAGERVVVLEEDAAPDAVRRVRRAGAWVLHGTLDDPETLGKRGKIALADEVFVATESEDEAISIVRSLYDVVVDGGRPGGANDDPLRCYLNLSPSGTRHHLHEQVGTSSGLRTRMGERDVLELHTYDEPTATAREILRRHPPDPPIDAGADSIHVVLVGWSSHTRALVEQLCHLLHVEEYFTRRVTVAAENPEARRQELLREFPCLEPTNFPAGTRREFVESLFPDIDFVDLPTRPERLLADGAELTTLFEQGQHLTVVVSDEQRLETGYLVSAIVPRLDEYATALDMDAEVLYYEADHTELGIEAGIEPEVLEQTTMRSFTDFYDDITPSAVRGTHRDRRAKRVALYYFLKYDYGSSETPAYLNERASELLSERDVDARWAELTSEQRDELADLLWNALSEHYRNANRHAADHVPFKRRLANRLRQQSATDGKEGTRSDDVADAAVIDRIAAVEHRRWCAEKLLSGWEPLTKDQWGDWDTDEMQSKLRARRYHRDLWPIEDLERAAPEEFQKDVEQVRFVLNEMQPDETET